MLFIVVAVLWTICSDLVPIMTSANWHCACVIKCAQIFLMSDELTTNHRPKIVVISIILFFFFIWINFFAFSIHFFTAQIFHIIPGFPFQLPAITNICRRPPAKLNSNSPQTGSASYTRTNICFTRRWISQNVDAAKYSRFVVQQYLTQRNDEYFPKQTESGIDSNLMWLCSPLLVQIATNTAIATVANKRWMAR